MTSLVKSLCGYQRYTDIHLKKKNKQYFPEKKCISEVHLLGSKSMGWNTMKLGFLLSKFFLKYTCGQRYLKKEILKSLYRKQVSGGIQLSKHQHLTSSELFFSILFVWMWLFGRGMLSMSPVSYLSSSIALKTCLKLHLILVYTQLKNIF